MDDALVGAVVERLGLRPLKAEAEALLLAACMGQNELERALGGEVLARPVPPDNQGRRPELAYLESLEVGGFRGIGPRTRLPLSPGPGFTLVVGRNGSGKSSFAEALEVLLTGEVRRWAERAVVWHEGWRNLHHSPPSIHLTLAVQGAGRATAELRWADGQDLGDPATVVQVAGEKRSGLDRLGWGEAIKAFRPFLSHSELEALLGRPSELYDLLAAVLGLDDLAATAERLRVAVRAAETPLSDVKKALGPLLGRLRQIDDERAAACELVLNGRTWDIDAAERVATGAQPLGPGGPREELRRIGELRAPALEDVVLTIAALRDAASRLETVTGTDSGRALKLADLLDAALLYHREHGDGDCPVCGRQEALNPAWQRETEQAIARLRAEAAVADDARQSARRALLSSNGLLLPEPQSLQTDVVDGTSKARSIWRTWLRAPIADDAEALRSRADHFEEHISALADAVEKTGVGAGRRQVDFHVTVDGTEGAALSVMSQGEVNALALSVFLPRVTMPASPFGFLIIDDPVQAMDPAKVEGLARVLSDTAMERQVIVFTHDDRLPEAVRRLGLAATILEVTRRPGSVVEVRRALDPPARAIEDARAIAADRGVPDDIGRRVVGGLCRMALESAFAEAYRRTRLSAGDEHHVVEDRLLASSTSLTARAALALFGDAERGGEVLTKLNGWGGRWAGDTYRACNKGAHGV